MKATEIHFSRLSDAVVLRLSEPLRDDEFYNEFVDNWIAYLSKRADATWVDLDKIYVTTRKIATVMPSERLLSFRDRVQAAVPETIAETVLRAIGAIPSGEAQRRPTDLEWSELRDRAGQTWTPFERDDILSGSVTSHPPPRGVQPVHWWEKLWAKITKWVVPHQNVAIYVVFRDGTTKMTRTRMAPGLLQSELGKMIEVLQSSKDVKTFAICEVVVEGRKTFGSDMMFTAEELISSLQAPANG